MVGYRFGTLSGLLFLLDRISHRRPLGGVVAALTLCPGARSFALATGIGRGSSSGSGLCRFDEKHALAPDNPGSGSHCAGDTGKWEQKVACFLVQVSASVSQRSSCSSANSLRFLRRERAMAGDALLCLRA